MKTILLTPPRLQRILAISGLSTYKTDFFDSKIYKQLRTTFLDNLPLFNVKLSKINLCSLAEVKKAGVEILEKHTNGIDITVPYSLKDKLEITTIERFGAEPEENKIDEIIKFIQNNIKLTKVTDIPITIGNNAHTEYSMVYEPFNRKFYEKLPRITTGIGIKSPINDLSKTTYVHEIYHNLSGRNKGFTQNYLYEEILPIFMEYVSALDIDENLIDEAVLSRLLSTKNDIIYLTQDLFNLDENSSIMEILESEKYILSTIYATALFNTYYHSSNKGKKLIDNEINKVLIGTQKLEDVLQKYEITPEKGTNIVKRQVKTLNKKIHL